MVTLLVRIEMRPQNKFSNSFDDPQNERDLTAIFFYYDMQCALF